MFSKTCTKCKEEKELEYFCPDKRAKDGRTSMCRECYRIQSMEYRAIHIDSRKEIQKKWRIKNHKEFNIMVKSWRKRNPDKFKLQLKRANDKYRGTENGRLHTNISNAIRNSVIKTLKKTKKVGIIGWVYNRTIKITLRKFI